MASCLFDHKQTEILDEYGRDLVQSMKGVIRSGHKVMSENIEVMCWKEKLRLSKDKVVTAYLRVRAKIPHLPSQHPPHSAEARLSP